MTLWYYSSDVVTIEKTGEFFRLIYDTKGRFKVHPISKDEAAYKLCKVKKCLKLKKSVPVLITHDARTIRFPHPDIKVNDTAMVEIATGKVIKFLKFEVGKLAMITGGANIGRVGVIQKREKLIGTIDIIHVKDAIGKLLLAFLDCTISYSYFQIIFLFFEWFHHHHD